MTSTDVARLEVALGMHTLKPRDPLAVRRRVRRVVRHKGFNARTLVGRFSDNIPRSLDYQHFDFIVQYNDVALLTLDSPVQFSRSISPVCLPTLGTNEQYVAKEAVVVGWGALKEGTPSALLFY